MTASRRASTLATNDLTGSKSTPRKSGELFARVHRHSAPPKKYSVVRDPQPNVHGSLPVQLDIVNRAAIHDPHDDSPGSSQVLIDLDGLSHRGRKLSKLEFVLRARR